MRYQELNFDFIGLRAPSRPHFTSYLTTCEIFIAKYSSFLLHRNFHHVATVSIQLFSFCASEGLAASTRMSFYIATHNQFNEFDFVLNCTFVVFR